MLMQTKSYKKLACLALLCHVVCLSSCRSLASKWHKKHMGQNTANCF